MFKVKNLGKYSIGMGDRFGRQGPAQLAAVMEAGRKGTDITPVWNKSNREHVIIGTLPRDVREEADNAARVSGFDKPYFVDADHINLTTVDGFIDSSDFFTIDVASYIGQKADRCTINSFVEGARKYTGKLKIPGINALFDISRRQVETIAEKYLLAILRALETYRIIEKKKGSSNFITEVSMDEVPVPQSPAELFFILKMLGEVNLPVQTIAPKFSGRFNKGVDYDGDADRFKEEFESDLMVIDHAVSEFGLPSNLKISIHSGSDKFSIYPAIRSVITKHDKGIHLKTAGTTWLEEIIGLSLSGGAALDFVKEIYSGALDRSEELCAPYIDVIDIDFARLPSGAEVARWEGSRLADSLRHVSDNRYYNPDMRQLMHLSYKLAALRMEEYYHLLEENKQTVSCCVHDNLYSRHICKIFDV
jgi:hypothetical protein